MERNKQVPGVVKFFNCAKGWGMVSLLEEDGGGDYFAHYSAIKLDGYRALYDGEPVLFVPCVGKKGRYADEIIPTGRKN